MTQATGSQAQILIGEESTYGTIPGTPAMTKLNCVVSENIGGTREELISGAINPARTVLSVRSGNQDVRGTLQCEVSPMGGFPFLLKHLMGTVQTGGASPPYAHDIYRGALPVGLYLEKGFTDISQYFPYTGVRINSANFQINAQGLLTASFDVIGKGLGTVAGSSLDGTPTDPAHEAVVHHDATLIEEGGSATTQLLGLDLTVTNNIDDSRYRVGSNQRVSAPEGRGEVSGTATFLFEDLTIYNKWLNETSTSLELKFAAPSTDIFWIDMPSVIYTGDAAPKIETPQGIVVAPTFRAIYDGVSSDIYFRLQMDDATIPA